MLDFLRLFVLRWLLAQYFFEEFDYAGLLALILALPLTRIASIHIDSHKMHPGMVLSVVLVATA